MEKIMSDFLLMCGKGEMKENALHDSLKDWFIRHKSSAHSIGNILGQDRLLLCKEKRM
jgi:hypothetical protein